jgi:hypothetical protein
MEETAEFLNAAMDAEHAAIAFRNFESRGIVCDGIATVDNMRGRQRHVRRVGVHIQQTKADETCEGERVLAESLIDRPVKSNRKPGIDTPGSVVS